MCGPTPGISWQTRCTATHPMLWLNPRGVCTNARLRTFCHTFSSARRPITPTHSAAHIYVPIQSTVCTPLVPRGWFKPSDTSTGSAPSLGQTRYPLPHTRVSSGNRRTRSVLQVPHRPPLDVIGSNGYPSNSSSHRTTRGLLLRAVAD